MKKSLVLAIVTVSALLSLSACKENNIVREESTQPPAIVETTGTSEEAKTTETTSLSTERKELLSFFTDRIGTEWIYNGFAEYGHTVRLNSINDTLDNGVEYVVSGEVADMSDGEATGDFGIYIEYIFTNQGVREKIVKGEKMPHKIKELDILRAPLVKGNTWIQEVKIDNKQIKLKAEILDISKQASSNKRLVKVQYTAPLAGMPNDVYREVRVFGEGTGLISFENTFDKDIEFNYHLDFFNKIQVFQK